MKKLICLNIALLSATLSQFAFADCTIPASGQELTDIIRRNLPGPHPSFETEFLVWHADNYYMAASTWDSSRGADDPFNPAQEWSSHLMGAALIEYGVSNDGLAAFDVSSTEQTWIDLGDTWHRSKDEYGPLARGLRNIACTGVANDAPSCFWVEGDPPYWHNGYYSRVKDAHSSGENYAGFMSLAPEFLIADPNYRITYYCGAFDSPVYTASVNVHEAWHRVAPFGHTHDDESGHCSAGDKACDKFVFHGKHTGNAELYERRNEDLGSYQVQSEFLCDLADEPQPWVPLVAQMEAGIEFASFTGDDDFWTWRNLRPEHYPYQCGIPRPLHTTLLTTPIGVRCEGFAGDGSGWRCDDSSQCVDGEECCDSTSGDCTFGCCYYTPPIIVP